VSHESTKLASLLIDPDWERILSRLARFNPFRVLRIADAEIRHSNVLGWLFDPQENHGFGDAFLRKFLLMLLQGSGNEARQEGLPSILEILDLPASDVTVFREFDRIDLMVVVERRLLPGLVILIENKWNSKERSNQLTRYKEKTNQSFAGYQMVPVFLTRDGQEPSDPSYLTATHPEIAKLLRSMLELWGERVSSQVRGFLSQYIEVIEENSQVDKELEALARKLFSRHEEAIRLVYGIGTSRSLVDGWTLFFESIHGEQMKMEALWGVQPGWIWFQLPEQREQRVNPQGWGNGMATCFWVRIEGDQIRMVLEAGPWDDPARRYAFIEHLNSTAKFSVWNKEGGQYTRLASVKAGAISDWSDASSIGSNLEDLWRRMQPAWERYRVASSNYFPISMPEAG